MNKEAGTLVDECLRDEIKLEVVEGHLPQSYTFKKWMKRLKVWGTITAIVLIIVVLATSILGYKDGETSENELLTLKKVVKTFKSQGLALKEDKSKYKDEFDLEGVKPAVYRIGKNKDTLLIYLFKSFVEREEVIRNANRFNDYYNIEEVAFKANNSLIVYIPAEIPDTMEGLEEIGKIMSSIKNIVFKDLNNGKEIVYKGESASWQGTFTYGYYEHWWQDEEGKDHYESYDKEAKVIKYKMSDIEAVGPIDFEYKTSFGTGGTSTGLELNKDGYVKAGGSSGSGWILRENETINFTVKWNGKEESMVLKAYN